MKERNMESASGFLSRRGFIKAIPAFGLAFGLPNWFLQWKALGFKPQPSRVTPFITPNKNFYLVAVNPSFRPAFSPQQVNAHWSLELVGLNGASRRFGYDELVKRATRKTAYTFECIGNRVGGGLIGNAQWHVIPLKELLQQAPGGIGGTQSVGFEGLDDFYSSVSVGRAIDDYAFIALMMNGTPLPGAHGFPARSILPDLYGMKQPRWLRKISLLADAHTTSFWEDHGWAGEVPVKTMSRIDPRSGLAAGKSADLSGIAFAGRRGIAKVEISFDDGKTWATCRLATPEMPDVWSLWRYTWPAPTAGDHTLMVRATDGSGKLQTAVPQDAAPDGASGYHEIDVDVTAG